MFSLEAAQKALFAQCDSYVALQKPDGAIHRADWGLDDPGATCSLVALCLYTGHHLEAVSRALDYLEAYQRPSGLTDLRDCNFDSSPDAGFILQAMCPAISSPNPLPLLGGGGEERAGGGGRSRTEAFLRRMVAGTLTGGFHTPNHRWVMSAGLALAEKCLPDLSEQIHPVIQSYLAEGFDLNADSAWIERSAGVYDAICAKSLLILAECGYETEACLEAVRRNLTLNLHLFHADGTIETGLSRRQDQGTRTVPSSLIIPLLWAGKVLDEPRFLQAAAFLQERVPTDGYSLMEFLRRFGEPGAIKPKLPESYALHYPVLQAHRIRRGELSVTVFGGTTRLLHLVRGQAELVSVKISQAYFGVGRFVGDSNREEKGAVVLRSEGKLSPYRPGDELPLGRPVPPENYQAMRAERALRRVADCTSELEVKALEDGSGVSLRYVTLDGLDRVPAQLALDFAVGGVWETDDTAFQPQAGQVIFLKSGVGRMHYGRDVIEISPGVSAHQMWAMRDSEPAAGLVRVLLTFLTPVDYFIILKTTSL
ncbi:hypothetical protein [Armatimonas sp.]|uniref:hypothetical protein n=1 Tax=Armatimonas sp. TaxID=1872638 RepID=UPI00286D0F7E|nr:hypothetical protein [Armatimonas sp.]